MVVSRREFVRFGSMCALSAGLSLGLINQALGQKRRGTPGRATSGVQVPIQAQRDPLFFMSRESFKQYLETQFIIDPGYTFPIVTKLVNVKDTRTDASKIKNAPGQECFLLTFQVEGDVAVKSGTYQVRHDALGTFELFVVPTEDKEGRLFFEAVINRVVE